MCTNISASVCHVCVCVYIYIYIYTAPAFMH